MQTELVRRRCDGAVLPLAFAPDEQHLVAVVDSGHLQLLDAGSLALGRETRLDGFGCWTVWFCPSCELRGSVAHQHRLPTRERHNPVLRHGDARGAPEGLA